MEKRTRRRARAAWPRASPRSGRASPPPRPRVRRFRARSRHTNGRRNCAPRAAGCANARSGRAPTPGSNARCRSPAPAGRKTAAAPMPRPETARPSTASATPCANDRRRRWPNSPARGRCGSAGWWRPPRCRAHRCRCRAWPAQARPRPRPTPPRSRRPDCRRRPPAWRGAGRVPATETRSPRCNWSCRRRSGRPAPPYRRASQGSPRDSCGNASASGDGCGRRSWSERAIGFLPLSPCGRGWRLTK